MMASERPLRRLSALLLVAILPSVLPTSAVAQPKAVSEEARKTAKALMEEGRTARDDAKDNKAALEAFRKAHTIMKVPSTGLEVARTLELMGLFVEAEEAAQEVLDLPLTAPKEPEAFVKARATAKEMLDSLKGKVAYVKVTIKGADKGKEAEVTIDDLSVAPAALSGPIKKNPGKHTVVAKGAKEDSAEVELAPGETKEVTLNVAKSAEKPKTDTTATATATEAPPPPKSAFLRPLPLAGFGVAAAGLLVGGITGALTLSKASDVKGKCDGTRCPSSTHDDISSAKTMGLVSTISFIVAGVGAGVGVVGLLMKPPTEQPPATGRVRVTPWIGVGSAGVVGQFLGPPVPPCGGEERLEVQRSSASRVPPPGRGMGA